MVNVTLTSVKGGIQPVQPITIGQSPTTVQTQSPEVEEVRDRIATFINLSKEKILVQES